MKKTFILVTILLLSFGLSRTVRAQTTNTSGARAQAITHLGQLVGTYDVSLNALELDQVQTICRELQSSTIEALRSDIQPQKEYPFFTVTETPLPDLTPEVYTL